MNINTDSRGLIVQTDGDGGDTLARSAEWYTGWTLNQNPWFQPPISFYTVLSYLEPNEDGILIRYPEAPYNDPYKAPWATSRDQTLACIIAAGYRNAKDFLKRYSKAQLKRGPFYQNWDLFAFDSLATLFRSFVACNSIWPLFFYPLIILGDIIGLGNVLTRCYYGRDFTDVGDDILLIQYLIQSKDFLPTPIGWLARKIYAKFRPFGIQHTMDYYHRPESKGNPLNELYRPIITEYFYGD